MKHRRTAYLVGIVTAVFIAVTFGLAPTINLIARLRSPHGYSEYEVTGAWVLGLLAAALVGGAYAGVASRRESGRARATPSPTAVMQDGSRRPLSAPNVCTAVGATIIGLGLGNAADNVVRFNQNRPFTVSLGGVVAGLGLGIFLAGPLIARAATRPRWALVVLEFGTFLAGYAFGGGLDDLLRESAGEPYSFALGAAFAGLGCGLAVIGWRALNAAQ